MTLKITYPLLDYSKYETTGHILPIFRKFQTKMKSLLYCGVNHTFDPTDTLFTTLKKEIREYNPDLIILEGGTKINSDNPKRLSYFESIKKKSGKELIQSKGEFGFTLKIAIKNDFEVFCPEPEFKEQINFLLKSYNQGQVFVNQILQMAVQFYSMDEDTDIKSYLTDEIEWQKSELSDDINWNKFNFTWDNFLIQFNQQFEVSFLNCKPNFINEINDPIPWSTKDYKWTQNNQITQDECNFRDNFILNKIQKKSKIYSKILVVYGGSHYYAQEQGLSQIYSK